jgi:hypothetical protein
MKPRPLVPTLRLLVVLALVASGCTGVWIPVKGKTPLAFLEVEAELPEGWRAYVFAEGTFLTRNGMELQSIHVRRWPRTSVVKGTNRSIEDGMLPQEIAELSLDSRRLDDGVGGLRVLENVPAILDGRDCYRTVYKYRNEPGLEMRTLEYGCAIGPWIYRFEYNAAAQHYYDAFLADFERLRQSVHFTLK